MRFLIKSSVIGFVFCFYAFSALAQSNDSGYVTNSRPVSGVAAVVNGEMLSLQDLQRQSGPEIARARVSRDDPQAEAKIMAIQRRVLDNMVLDALIAQEAERLGVKASDSDIDAGIQQILSQNKIDMPTLERSLAAQGLTIDFLRNRIRNNQTNSRLMQIMVTQKVLVPQADVEKYYNEHPGEFMKNKVVTLEVIVFPPHRHADVSSIVAKIKNGSLSFEKAAQTYSVGPAAASGGKVGAMDWENVSPAWRAALNGVSVGGLTPVFQLDEAEIVIKLVSEVSGEPKTLSEAESEVERILKEPLLQERFKEYTQQLRNKAVIDVRL